MSSDAMSGFRSAWKMGRRRESDATTHRWKRNTPHDDISVTGFLLIGGIA